MRQGSDAITTKRWYLVVAMGRSAGHLALGIGKSAGATPTVIAEEFPRGEPIRSLRPERVRSCHHTEIVHS
jgi:6-phosphofructokinase 1